MPIFFSGMATFLYGHVKLGEDRIKTLGDMAI